MKIFHKFNCSTSHSVSVSFKHMRASSHHYYFGRDTEEKKKKRNSHIFFQFALDYDMFTESQLPTMLHDFIVVREIGELTVYVYACISWNNKRHKLCTSVLWSE